MSSDSASSEVTYTSILSHGDPLAWDVDFFRLQEPDLPEAPPASLDYVPSLKEPEQAPISPDYVPGPEYPEYLAPLDEEIPVEDQPYVVADSPIALSPGYVADSNPEEVPEEDSEDGPVDYPAFGGDGDDDDSYDDNDEEGEASEEEEDKHLAPTDSVVAPIVDHVPSFKETEPLRLMSLRLHHRHVVPLLGYLSDPRNLCLFHQRRRSRDFLPYHHPIAFSIRGGGRELLALYHQHHHQLSQLSTTLCKRNALLGV
ncbi:hypothetical protein Tco_1416246 [Tanacetum coccineum]